MFIHQNILTDGTTKDVADGAELFKITENMNDERPFKEEKI